MSGSSPSVDPGMPSRSRNRLDNTNNDPNATLVSSATTVSFPQWIDPSPNNRDATLVEETSNTSLQASLNNGRRRHQPPQGLGPGDGTNFNDATFSIPPQNPFGGVDVSNSHHSVALGDHVISRAVQSLSDSFITRDAALHMLADTVQFAAFERNAALAAIPDHREEADATLAVLESGLELTECSLPQRAHQNRQLIQQEVQPIQATSQEEVDLWIESSNRPFQNRFNLGNQQLADRDFQITERDSRMLSREHQLAATQQRLNVALVSPDLINSYVGVLDSPSVFEDLSGIPSTIIQQPNAATNKLLSPISLPYAPDSSQVVAVPTVVEATGRVNPLDSNGVHGTSDASQVVAPHTVVGAAEWLNPLVPNGSQFTSDPMQVVAVPAAAEATLGF